MDLIPTVEGAPVQGVTGWAVAALWRELVEFRFSYDVAAVAEVDARGLAYHIASERLFFDAMRLGVDGVPVSRSRTHDGHHNPAYVAWYGLASLTRWHAGRDSSGSARFQRQLEWLATNARPWAAGGTVWTYDFDWEEGPCRFRAPWISGMAQGLAISALVRGHRLTHDPSWLTLARAATRVFEVDLDEGGVRTWENGLPLYEEYPGRPLPRILDGFCFGLLGLYDLWVETGDEDLGVLFRSGVAGLEQQLPSWDYHGRWSIYGAHRHLCPPHYHVLNSVLLSVLGRLADRPALRSKASAWAPVHRHGVERAALYLAYQLTKNRTRFREKARRLLRG